MSEYARTSAGVSIEIINIERPNSFFQLIEERFENCDPLRRIFSQVRLHQGKTMVVETLDNPEDLREENEDLKKHSGDFEGSTALRLSFFKNKFATKSDIHKIKSRYFIGYAVLKTDRGKSFGAAGQSRRVYESVIKVSRHDNNFIRGTQQWRSRVYHKTFKVRGYLYAQQNTKTNVCAHVAIRTAAARFHPAGDMSYREMNNLLGFDQVKFKSGGLDLRQMVKVLEAAGAKCFHADYSAAREGMPPFHKYIYGSIESGYPAIIIFGTNHESGCYHAIPVFGHTFNQDTWVPNANISYFKVGEGTQYIPSESWLSTYVGHDDYWGSNFCIPRHFLQPWEDSQVKAKRRKSKQKQEFIPRVAHIIGTMPKEVQLNAVWAEVIGADYLFTILGKLPPIRNKWANRLLAYAKEKKLVLRPYLVRPVKYTAHLSQIHDWQNHKIDPRFLKLFKSFLPDEWLWMIELSVPELFSTNLRKVGEVLVRAEVVPNEKRDFESFVLARLPGYFALRSGRSSSNPKFQFFPSGAEGHVELIGCEEK